MKKLNAIILALFLMFFSLGISFAQADEFVDNFDMFGNYNQFLYSTTNAHVLHEHWGSGWHVDYWAPTASNQWAEIVYKYDLDFTIWTATVYGAFAMFRHHNPTTEGHLDVSSDGINWTTVEVGNQIPRQITPIDISDVLRGSTTAYVRAMLYQEGPIGRTAQAQFLRTDIRSGSYQAPHLYEFLANSAPDTEHIDGVADGDYIHFGGRDWIMLDNLTGYAILKDYAGTEKIAFDAGGGQTWDYNGKTASSKLYLNTTFFNSLGDDKDFIDNSGEWLIEAGVNDPEYTWNGKVGMLTKTEFEYYNENGPNLTGTSIKAISFPIEDPNFFGQWWLLTPGVGYSSGDSIVRFIADYNKISATDSRATHQGFIRPTLHLKSDLYVKNGDGTSENPKIITDDPNQNEPPMADAGPAQTVELASSDGTEVTLDGSESTDTDSSPETNDDIVDFDWYQDDILLGSGETFAYTFPLGTHTVKLVVTDSAGESAEDEVAITIEDTTPPEVAISASPGTLWPPNGKMKDVLIQGEATDISGEVNLALLVEDEYGEINLSLSEFDKIIQLEAWRKGNDKDGRTYTINVIATDSSGNGAFASTLVVVPHDMGGDNSKK